MSNQTQNPFLRNAMLIDAAASGAMGLALVIGAAPFAGLLGLPETLLRVCGIAFLPYAALLVFTGTRRVINLTIVKLVIAGNLLWAVASGLLLVTGSVSPTGLGYGFVILQALAVLVFAEFQIIGYRRHKLPMAMMA